MHVETYEITDRRQWLARRGRDVTASDLGALFNLNPKKSRFRLWQEKTGRIAEPLETPVMRRGRWLEPAVLTALADEMPTTRFTPLRLYLTAPEHRLGGTPDAVADDDRTVELKVVSRPIFEAWGDQPPMSYQLQCLANCMLMNAPAGIIACLVLDTYSAEIAVFDVERTPEAEAKIIDGVSAFWQSVADNNPPPPDYGGDDDLIARLFRPKAEAEPIDLSADNRLPELLDERQGLKDAVTTAEERLDAINAEIVHKLGGAPIGLCGDWRITNKVQHRQERIQPATSFPVLLVKRKRKAAA